jgi:hypothetical protein
MQKALLNDYFGLFLHIFLRFFHEKKRFLFDFKIINQENFNKIDTFSIRIIQQNHGKSWKIRE